MLPQLKIYHFQRQANPCPSFCLHSPSFTLFYSSLRYQPCSCNIFLAIGRAGIFIGFFWLRLQKYHVIEQKHSRQEIEIIRYLFHRCCPGKQEIQDQFAGYQKSFQDQQIACLKDSHLQRITLRIIRPNHYRITFEQGNSPFLILLADIHSLILPPIFIEYHLQLLLQTFSATPASHLDSVSQTTFILLAWRLPFQLVLSICNFIQMGSIQGSPSLDSNDKFKNQELQRISKEFCLEKEEIHQLYSCFSQFQNQKKAYLTLDDLAQTLHYGQLHFSQLPYLQRLFRIIARKTPGKLFFEQYVVGISTFCLMSGEAVLHFVFDWLDQDGDGQINREDIARAVEYTNPRTNRKTFLCNFMTELDRHLKKGHNYLQFEQFRQLKNKLLFLVWPAYELQLNLRQRNIGIDFWQKQYLKIEKAEQLLRNHEKRSARIQDKIAKLTNIKKIKTHQEQTLKHIMTRRQPKSASTDLQMLETRPPQRRRSCPYIKGKLIVSNIEAEEEFIEGMINMIRQ